MYIGAHISISKGFANAVEQANEIGANTLQFFSRNPRGSKAKALDQNDIDKALEKIIEYKFGKLVAHAPYIMNLASPKDDLWELAITIIADDLNRIDKMGVHYLTLHPGSHVKTGSKAGIKRISEGLNKIFSKGKTKSILLLETMSGSGSEVGGTFDEIAEIIELLDDKHRIGVCLDTCHLFGAGYDIKDNLNKVLEQFDKLIGIDKIKAVHLNDSLIPLGSNKDRHANIGEGLIGREALVDVVKNKNLINLPFILETPGGLDNYRKEINFLATI